MQLVSPNYHQNTQIAASSNARVFFFSKNGILLIALLSIIFQVKNGILQKCAVNLLQVDSKRTIGRENDTQQQQLIILIIYRIAVCTATTSKWRVYYMELTQRKRGQSIGSYTIL